MRIGYLFRGFLADVKLDYNGNELSTPDGNATYSWSIEHECHKRGYKLIPLGQNLDAPAAKLLGAAAFNSFSGDRRSAGYERMLKSGWIKLSDKKFPDLDLVLIEWRWPIPGRNTPYDRSNPLYQNDLERQREVISYYSELSVPIVIWDLDHKLTSSDVLSLSDITNFAIIETATKPMQWATRVEPPTLVTDLLQHPIDRRLSTHHIGYIGSRYERDETIDHWIKPITPANTHRAKFWGKWEPYDEVRERWPGITFAGRIGVKDFRSAYSRVSAVPLLAKKSYYETGFITPRPWEAVLFGSIPVGLDGHLGIEQYTNHVAKDSEDLLRIAREIRSISPIRREVLREEAAHKLSHMDVKNFVNVLEKLAKGPGPSESKEEDGKDR